MTKKRFIILLTTLCAVSIGVFLYLNNRTQFILQSDIQVEVNQTFDLSSYITKMKGYQLTDLEVDNTQVDTTKVGQYELTYQLKDKSYTTTVSVVDTTSPIVVGKDVSVSIGSDVTADMFVESIEDASETTVSFKDNYDFSDIGEYDVEIVVIDTSNNTTTITQHLVVFKDESAPTLKNIDTITIYTGTKIDYKKNVKIQDDHDEAPTYTVDASKVNIYSSGEYEAIYTTKDCYNNTKQYTRKVIVKRRVNPISVGQSSDKVIYLTFDDGPSANTGKILDILDSYNVKATFFVTGNGKAYNNYIIQANSKGHTIALHTYKHNYAMYGSLDTYLEDLNNVASMVEGLIGYRPHYLRFPGGSSNTVSRKYCHGIMTTLSQEVTTLGYRYYDWNADSGDANGATIATDKIIAQATSCTKNNIMMLFHDSQSKTTTVEALPTIIEHYQSLGYTFKAIDDSSFTPHHPIAN